MSMASRKRNGVAQAWIELRADDPEAVSALAVARAHLAAGRRLRRLRRLRLVEVAGRLPKRERFAALLHQSTQFYNPHKERCTIRMAEEEAVPLAVGERAVLVVERDGERRAAAERWWLHETGGAVEVREGAVWLLLLEGGDARDVEDLALVRERRHGLLCNPHSQDLRVAGDSVPLPWLETPAAAGRARPPRKRSR